MDGVACGWGRLQKSVKLIQQCVPQCVEMKKQKSRCYGMWRQGDKYTMKPSTNNNEHQPIWLCLKPQRRTLNCLHLWIKWEYVRICANERLMYANSTINGPINVPNLHIVWLGVKTVTLETYAPMGLGNEFSRSLQHMSMLDICKGCAWRGFKWSYSFSYSRWWKGWNRKFFNTKTVVI